MKHQPGIKLSLDTLLSMNSNNNSATSWKQVRSMFAPNVGPHDQTLAAQTSCRTDRTVPAVESPRPCPEPAPCCQEISRCAAFEILQVLSGAKGSTPQTRIMIRWKMTWFATVSHRGRCQSYGDTDRTTWFAGVLRWEGTLVILQSKQGMDHICSPPPMSRSLCT